MSASRKPAFIGIIYFSAILSAVCLGLMLGIACNTEEDQYKRQMADWHVRWEDANIHFENEVQIIALLEELEAIKPPWKGGPELARHQDYVRAHRQYYLANQAADELVKQVWDSLAG